MSHNPIHFACPLPSTDYPRVLLAHGGGGMLTHKLIEQLFLPAFDNPELARRHDGALLDVDGRRLAFTTDGFVVRPLFFPGGDIGSLAINGTVNDLACCGARPRWISSAMILEEGFPMESLQRIVASMRAAAEAAGVQLVTGDTKVVEHGHGDGIFIVTSGLGTVAADVTLGPAAVRPGDAILLSGDLGRHGIAIMAHREGLDFETPVASDCAPLADLVLDLLDAGIGLHCARDLTRGGLAAALIEIAEAAGLDMAIDEPAVPVADAVRGACEILGLDPLYVANEGRLALLVDPADADRALTLLRRRCVDTQPARIGTVQSAGAGRVSLTGALGVARPLTMFSGEQLPRIC